MLLQFAVLVATFVTVFGAQETSITFLVTFHSQITTERLFGLRETTARLGNQDLENNPIIFFLSKEYSRSLMNQFNDVPSG